MYSDESKILSYLKAELAQLPNVTPVDQAAAVTLDVKWSIQWGAK